MITPLVRIFRNLISERSLRVIKKNITVRTTNIRRGSEMRLSYLVKDNESVKTQNAKSFLINLIKNCKNPESIQWKETETQLIKLNVKEYRKEILRVCLMLMNLEASISYFNYVQKSGQKFTAMEMIFFAKLFENERGRIPEYESTLKYVYENIKDAMKYSHEIKNFVLKPFSEVESCFDDFTENYFDTTKGNSKERMFIAALKFKNEDLAYKVMNDFKISKGVFKSYIDYLCKLVIENKFHPQMLTNIAESCENNICVIESDKAVQHFQILVKTLMEHNKDYEWTLNECIINNNSVCSCCKMKLIDKCISENDFNLMKKSFLAEAGLLNQDVFLTSSNEELRRFSHFLENAKPYGIVFDGMNMIFRSYRSSIWLHTYLKHFINQKLNVLIISKMHTMKSLMNMKLLQNAYFKERTQFFFTENLSDDDVFIMYAALHGGIGTYLCTGDFLQSYTLRLNQDIQKIFVKWKLYHQYVLTKNDMCKPWPFLGLSQLTEQNENRFIWHFSHYHENTDFFLLNSSVPIKWVCLQAHKKIK